MNDEIFKEKFLYFARRHSRLSPPKVPSGRKPTVDELASNVAFIEFVEKYVAKYNGKTDTQETYIAGAAIVDKKGISVMVEKYPNPYKLLEKEAVKKPKRFTNKTLVLL